MANKEGKKRSGCRTVLIILLILVLVLAAAVFIWFKTHLDEISKVETGANVGDAASEFEVTTTDGQSVSMSGLLEGKDVLVVVLFATWCGPCEKEFPEMDKVYQKYQDKMGMIGLDIDVLDDEEGAIKYADSHGFSFPIAYAKDLPKVYSTSAYPTTLIIDRNGKIACCRVGSIPDEETFEKIVTTFMGDDYQEKQLGYYTFYAFDQKGLIPGVEFSVTSESGTETYKTEESGAVAVFTDKPGEIKVEVISVPDGYKIDDNGEVEISAVSTMIKLPVSRK